MEIYRVGGCVRDELLGIDHNDVDYVVTGTNADDMITLGFTPVGKSFEVFIHPSSGEEYALARREISTGPGHTDFKTYTKDVSLNEDLWRRDLTINAMAIDNKGNLHDPYGGKKDLERCLIRNVSEHFFEDPLRILRALRLAAKLSFRICHILADEMKEAVANGALRDLSPERIYGELSKAIINPNSVRYFELLKEYGVLKSVIPVLDNMEGVRQREDYHAEGDVWVHNMMVLDQAEKLSKGLEDHHRLFVMFGALFHDVGKTMTPPELEEQGKHHEHDSFKTVKPLMAKLKEDLKLPNNIHDFCLEVAVIHQGIHRYESMSHKGKLKLFERHGLLNSNSKGTRHVKLVTMCCEADALGRKNGNGKPLGPYAQKHLFLNDFKKLQRVRLEQDEYDLSVGAKQNILRTRRYDVLKGL